MFHCTFINAAAEAALEATATVNKLHVGTHVGFASVTANGSRLAVVHHQQRRLPREAKTEVIQCKVNSTIFTMPEPLGVFL